ncbi:MAG: hypothetical protein [Circular genetic element sp.]|nr:MAG: hypothetical protein [Circular genetic element sp.]
MGPSAGMKTKLAPPLAPNLRHVGFGRSRSFHQSRAFSASAQCSSAPLGRLDLASDLGSLALPVASETGRIEPLGIRHREAG